MVDFGNCTKAEEGTISKIVKRAHAFYGGKIDTLSFNMDIHAVHAKEPLRLKAWLMADNFNFLHDVSGIIRFMDRKTGLLPEWFSPRYSKQNRPAGLQVKIH